MSLHIFFNSKLITTLYLGMLNIAALGQIPCPQGDIAYERIPGHRLDGFIETKVSSSGSIKICAELCSGKRRTTLEPSAVPLDSSLSCGFFNFQNGILENQSLYTISHCHLPVQVDLTKEVMLREQIGFDTYNQICLQGTSKFITKHCPTKVSIFTRIPGRKPLQSSSTRIFVSSREECIETCLLTTAIRCSSASFNRRDLICHLNDESNISQYTMEEDTDYLENNCMPEHGSTTEEVGNNYYNNYPGAYRLFEKSAFFSKKAKGQEQRLPQRMSKKCTNQTFRQVRSRTQIRPQYILWSTYVHSLEECEKECVEEKRFKCQSFNFVVKFSPTANKNCELSDQNTFTLDINDSKYFDFSGNRDFYVRETRDLNCIDVSQTCSPNGMEFTLRTAYDFSGRIYTHRHFDRPKCFIRGLGKRVHSFKIPGPNGMPKCGTEKFGDTLTNIVVVQFSESVQTSDDVMYNLTCTVVAPGDAVVTSSYIGSGSGQPTPIEYLPAEHTLDSRVRLVIQYQGRPTTTIAVGDPLEFKLETQDGKHLLQDIFATDVVAKDPYSAREVQLIDRQGCPIDPYVFPSLGLARNGDGLSTSFNAFKIPESNFLVFEATVHTCKKGCPAVLCDAPEGRQDSYGRRRKRSMPSSDQGIEGLSDDDNFNVKEILQVFESRAGISNNLKPAFKTQRAGATFPSESIGNVFPNKVCLSEEWYYACIIAMIGCVITMPIMVVWVYVTRRRAYNPKMEQFPKLHTNQTSPNSRQPRHINQLNSWELANVSLRRNDPKLIAKSNSWFGDSEQREKRNCAQHGAFQDPSEPIFTDPALFEKSPSK